MVDNKFSINAAWEQRDGRNICRYIMVWKIVNDSTLVGALGGYSGGGSFQLQQFVAKYSDGDLASLKIDLEDKITGEDIEFFSDVASELLEICDDAQDIVLGWHNEDEWEEAEQLLLLEERKSELQAKDDLLIIATGKSEFIKIILELAGITATPPA